MGREKGAYQMFKIEYSFELNWLFFSLLQTGSIVSFQIMYTGAQEKKTFKGLILRPVLVFKGSQFVKQHPLVECDRSG